MGISAARIQQRLVVNETLADRIIAELQRLRGDIESGSLGVDCREDATREELAAFRVGMRLRTILDYCYSSLTERYTDIMTEPIGMLEALRENAAAATLPDVVRGIDKLMDVLASCAAGMGWTGETQLHDDDAAEAIGSGVPPLQIVRGAGPEELVDGMRHDVEFVAFMLSHGVDKEGLERLPDTPDARLLIRMARGFSCEPHGD